jgi:tRNA (adenine22-N1)-methyltransferase
MMLMILNKRISNLIRPFRGMGLNTIADIGSDHGWTACYALLEGVAERAIATDITPHSVGKMEETFNKRGCRHLVDIRIGDGLSLISPAEAEGIVIAGMGGMLMSGILERGLHVALAAKKLVLSPQKDLPAFRASLHGMGLMIEEEALIEEKEKLYNILVCSKGSQRAFTPEELAFGRHLIEAKDGTLALQLSLSLEKDRALHIELAGGKPTSQTLRKLVELRRGMKMKEKVLEWLR